MAESKEYSARIMAVQTCYQAMHSNIDIKQVMKEQIDRGCPIDIEGQNLPKPDKILFQKIINNLEDRKEDIKEIYKANVTKKEAELLLKSIMLCAITEILCHSDIDTALIINDYLNITHAFYEQSQVSLVNGLIDNISKNIR